VLDHIGLRVGDLERALEFYKRALAPLGYRVIMEFPGVAGLGEPGKPDLWLMKSDLPVNPAHVSFGTDRGRVDAFHAAALAAGGTDNGAPGLRLDYHEHYYGAFVLDPEGNNIEAVCHAPPGPPPSARKASASRAKKKTAAKKTTKKTKKATAKATPAKKPGRVKTKPKVKTKKKR
jgi:catechol 2,3-dioxygenase-like lactoylglutathione lyase family enzyme